MEPGKTKLTEDKVFVVGVTGTILAAICCFTPILVWLLAAIGLSAIIGVLDYVLLPALGIFIIITGYAAWKRTRSS